MDELLNAIVPAVVQHTNVNKLIVCGLWQEAAALCSDGHAILTTPAILTELVVAVQAQHASTAGGRTDLCLWTTTGDTGGTCTQNTDAPWRHALLASRSTMVVFSLCIVALYALHATSLTDCDLNSTTCRVYQFGNDVWACSFSARGQCRI